MLKKGFTISWEKVEWVEYDDANGKVAVCIDSGEREKLNATRIKREAKFRKNLLEADKKCVITNETTKEALEAAHIISVEDGGKDHICNGVMLRSDIHKLYDANKFIISETGKIEINSKKIKGVSKKYKDLLSASKINSKTISRIQDALSEKHALSEKA